MKEEYSMEHFDDDFCDLFNSYIGESFVSSNNKQFFDDEDLVDDFDYHLDGLRRLILRTRSNIK
jgi:hypothetical protein